MEQLTKKEFDERYGQGHKVFFEKDIKSYKQDIKKAIEGRPGFKNDIIEKAKAQLIDLQPKEVKMPNGESKKVYVMEMGRSEEMSSFLIHKSMISKAVDENLLTSNKGNELIVKAAKKYNVGDISNATGLEKQPDGSWAPPKKGEGSGKDDEDSEEKRSKDDDDSKYESKSEANKEEILEGLSDSQKDKIGDYLNSMDQTEIDRFKEDVKNGDLHRDAAVAKLRLIGMDESKANELVGKMVPQPKNIDEFAQMVKDGRVPEDDAIQFMTDMGFDEEEARDKVNNAKIRSAVEDSAEESLEDSDGGLDGESSNSSSETKDKINSIIDDMGLTTADAEALAKEAEQSSNAEEFQQKMIARHDDLGHAIDNEQFKESTKEIAERFFNDSEGSNESSENELSEQEEDDGPVTVAEKEDEPGATENDTGGTNIPDEDEEDSASDDEVETNTSDDEDASADNGVTRDDVMDAITDMGFYGVVPDDYTQLAQESSDAKEYAEKIIEYHRDLDEVVDAAGDGSGIEMIEEFAEKVFVDADMNSSSDEGSSYEKSDSVRSWSGDRYEDDHIKTVVDAIEETGFDIDSYAKLEGGYGSPADQSEAVWDKVNEMMGDIQSGNWHKDLDEKDVENILYGIVMSENG